MDVSADSPNARTAARGRKPEAGRSRLSMPMDSLSERLSPPGYDFDQMNMEGQLAVGEGQNGR